MASGSRRDRGSKLAAVLPLVVDPQCLDVQVSAEQGPAQVMEQYTAAMGAGQFVHRTAPPRIGALPGLTQATETIKLWTSGEGPIDSSDDQCDFAARAVAMYLDRQAESASADADSSDDSESEFRQRQRRQRNTQNGSELEMHEVM